MLLHALLIRSRIQKSSAHWPRAMGRVLPSQPAGTHHTTTQRAL